MEDTRKKRKYRGRGNGNIKKIGKRYSVTTTVLGIRRYTTVNTIAEAEQIIRAAKEENRSWHPPMANLKMTVQEYAVTWLPTLKVKATTLASYESNLALYVLPFFGNRPISTIGCPDIRSFLSALSDNGCSEKTVKNIVSVLSKMISCAVADGICKTNPVAFVDIPRRSERFEPDRVMDENYYLFIHLIKGDKYEDLYFIALTTGMRKGELIALKWSDIDFEKREILIKHQMQLDKVNGTGKYVETTLKNAKRRTIVVSKATIERLKKMLNAQRIMEESGYLKNPEEYVFLSEDDTHLKASSIDKRFRRFILSHPELPQKMRFHDLRGSFVTHLFDLGASPKAVSAMVGHSTVGFTADFYCSPSKRTMIEAAALLDEDFRLISQNKPVRSIISSSPHVTLREPEEGKHDSNEQMRNLSDENSD